MGVIGRIFRIFWYAVRALALFIGIGVLGLLVFLLIAAPWSGGGDDIPDVAVLDLSFNDRLSEKAGAGQFLKLVQGKGLSVHRMVRVIERAADDERIQAVMIDLSAADVPLTHGAQLATAMAKFRASGKTSYAYATQWDFGRYRLASAFDEIWMPASGEFAVGGIALQTPYAGELISDLGIEPQLEKRKRFKSAADVITERRMSDDLRAALKELVDDVRASAMTGITGNRAAVNSVADLQAALDGAFWSPEKALELGLVDRLAHRATLTDLLDERHVSASEYLSVALKAPEEPKARIALIAATGEIRDGYANPLETDTIASVSLVETLRFAADDPEIDGIVLRIDSPGGGYAPSDAIAETIANIEKPVVVTMGSVAGSGGYMIAMTADRIVAHPSTITGSIGVIGGKIVIEDLLSDYGVRFETVGSGPHAAINSPFTRYTSEERAMLSRRIDAIYAAFTSAVAENRGLTADEVERAAQGRVWTGNQALELGLVDRLGGLEVAFEEAAQALSLQPSDPVEIVEFPRLSATQRLFHAADLGFVSVRSRINWLRGWDHAVERLEAEGGIRVRMPDLILD
ncbi:signal peptide peptidase SppA [Minwuia sp.]|uniref:signal peptide peptidase SppA n=1 Tax=Minwuia sp. TaxID=2493630 RepID=UPI003A950789